MTTFITHTFAPIVVYSYNHFFTKTLMFCTKKHKFFIETKFVTHQWHGSMVTLMVDIDVFSTNSPPWGPVYAMYQKTNAKIRQFQSPVVLHLDSSKFRSKNSIERICCNGIITSTAGDFNLLPLTTSLFHIG